MASLQSLVAPTVPFLRQAPASAQPADRTSTGRRTVAKRESRGRSLRPKVEVAVGQT